MDLTNLTGFTKEQFKVLATTGGNLRIFGERPIGGNKIRRFFKEIPIPSTCDQNEIKASFRDGMLHIKHPKLIVPVDEKQQEQAKPSAEVPKSDQSPAPQPTRPAYVPREQSNGPEQAVQEAPPKATEEKQTGEKTDEPTKEAGNVSEKAPDKEKEMNDKINATNESEKPMGEEKKGWGQEEKTSTSEKRENLGDSVQDAAEKENVETKKLDGTDNYQLGINMVSLKYKQVLDGLAMGLKDPKKMMNMVLAVLLVVVLAVYLRNAIRSLRNH